jgi:hypothetical protein
MDALYKLQLIQQLGIVPVRSSLYTRLYPPCCAD